MDQIADTLSHDDLIEISNSAMTALINSDPLLSDLPGDIILEEINSQIAVEHGQAITIIISREDEPPLKVIWCRSDIILLNKKGDPKDIGNNRPISLLSSICKLFASLLLNRIAGKIDSQQPLVQVPQSAKIIDLKKAIARHFEMYQKRTGNKVKISWRYIWRIYNLHYDGLILDDDCSPIEDYGVCNKVTLQFKKKRKNKR